MINAPSPSDYPSWAAAEISLVDQEDLLKSLNDSRNKSIALLRGLDDNQLDFRYAEGKWSIREIWQHIIDTERVLSYRAMRYSRGDKTVLSGFDAEMYTKAIRRYQPAWSAVLEDYATVRSATVSLFGTFDEEMLAQRGQAGRSEMTVRSVGFLIAGHDIHHLRTIREKYLQ
jgi:hypothetical protein